MKSVKFSTWSMCVILSILFGMPSKIDLLAFVWRSWYFLEFIFSLASLLYVCPQYPWVLGTIILSKSSFFLMMDVAVALTLCLYIFLVVLDL
jgi:hypothetical protein